MKPIRMWSALVLAMVTVSLLGCDPGSPESPGSPGDPGSSGGRQAADEAVQVYEVRGQIMTLPAPDDARRRMQIRHEAIPNFINDLGEVTVMPAMAMPLRVAPAVSLEGIEAGDKVAFVYEVDWSRFSSQVTEIRKLPDDTVLNLDEAESGHE